MARCLFEMGKKSPICLITLLIIILSPLGVFRPGHADSQDRTGGHG